MKFQTQQVEQFREEGWLGVPEFWSEREIAAMRVELARLQEQGLLRNVTTEGDAATWSQTSANLQLCPMYPHSRFFRAMPFAAKVAHATGANSTARDRAGIAHHFVNGAMRDIPWRKS